jgi:hypothetical protein
VARSRLARAVEGQLDADVVTAFDAVLAEADTDYRHGLGPAFASPFLRPAPTPRGAGRGAHGGATRVAARRSRGAGPALISRNFDLDRLDPKRTLQLRFVRQDLRKRRLGLCDAHVEVIDVARDAACYAVDQHHRK